MSEWILMSDRKPPNNCYVLVAVFDNRPKVKMYSIQIAARINDGWINDRDGELLNPKYGLVTHWMPLPDEPNCSTHQDLERR